MGEDFVEISSEIINTENSFLTVLQQMYSEGNGVITAKLITHIDAAKLCLAASMGIFPDGPAAVYFLECDRFLGTLAVSAPLCSADRCDHPMKTHDDVGCMVVVHGLTDKPTAFIMAGICSPCWSEKYKLDRDDAMSAFMEYLHRCVPSMKSYKREEWETHMAGNAPSTTSIN